MCQYNCRLCGPGGCSAVCGKCTGWSSALDATNITAAKQTRKMTGRDLVEWAKDGPGSIGWWCLQVHTGGHSAANLTIVTKRQAAQCQLVMKELQTMGFIEPVDRAAKKIKFVLTARGIAKKQEHLEYMSRQPQKAKYVGAASTGNAPSIAPTPDIETAKRIGEELKSTKDEFNGSMPKKMGRPPKPKEHKTVPIREVSEPRLMEVPIEIAPPITPPAKKSFSAPLPKPAPGMMLDEYERAFYKILKSRFGDQVSFNDVLNELKSDADV